MSPEQCKALVEFLIALVEAAIAKLVKWLLGQFPELVPIINAFGS